MTVDRYPSAGDPPDDVYAFERPSWHEHAACRGMDQDIFFPPRGTSTKVLARARRICASCPVREQCLTFAVDNHEEAGMWGGVSGRGRRRLRLAVKEVGA